MVSARLSRSMCQGAESRDKILFDKLNHIAIATPDLEASAQDYRDMQGVDVSNPIELPEHGVTVIIIKLSETTIELITPLGENSPIANFMIKNPEGGIHHFCYEVEDMNVTIEKLKKDNIRILGDGEPKVGAHGKPVLFLHPKDVGGTLIEIEEA